jgi:putative peptidoglycan lipid II flippase
MFAGVDFLLNYTFYARQDTRTPAIVGVIAVGVYFVVAWTLKGPLGFLGLVLADSAKQFAHAAIMTVLLLGTPARLHHQGILKTLAKASGAAIFMGAAAALLVRWLPAALPGRFIGELMLLLAIGVACGALYLLALSVLRVPEVQILSVPARRLAARIKARG